jgi:mercuric ion transport protein
MAIALISHVGVCPTCWPLVGGLMSSLGVTLLIETRYLVALMIGCLALAAAVLSYGARRNYRPFALGIMASGVILIGRFVLDSAPVTLGGACLLVAAFVWSFWLRQQDKASPSPSCVSRATKDLI